MSGRRIAAGRFAAAAALAAAWIAVAAGPACVGGRTAAGRSLVVVTLDTTRADRIGVYGGTAVPTPNLDRVAGEGAMFLDAWTQVPLTLPAHASLFTGRYPAAHGVRHNGIYRLPDDEITLAEVLKDEGFETAAFVAAYVLNRGFGLDQGFDAYEDLEVDRFEGGEDQLFRAERPAEAVNDEVFRWLDGRPRGGRVFLWVHYYDPHAPYEPPERPDRRLHGSGYDREISYVDACFGELVDRLERDGLLDDSVLVVVGDHGESLDEHGESTHGIFLYESAVRVPFFIRAPGLLPPGRTVEGPVEITDLTPTVLDLLGVRVPPGVQAESLLPRIRGGAEPGPRLARAETLMPRLEFGWSELMTVRDGRFKYVEAPTPELYDLERDPGETVNLAGEDPERAGRMAALIGEWVAAAEAGRGSGSAGRTLSPEELERLQSLGYLGGDAPAGADDDKGRPRPDPKDMIAEVARVDAARERLNLGDAQGALRDASAIVAESPLNHQARATIVRSLIRLGRLEEAETEALAYLAASENDPEIRAELEEAARGFLASVYRLQGRHAEAEEQYRRVLDLRASNDSAAVDLARLLIDVGRAGDAVGLVQGVLERDPRNGMALAARFLVEEALGEVEAARRTAAVLADAGTGDPPVLLRAGRLLLREKDFSRAAVCLKLAMRDSESDVELLGQLGTAQLGAGQLAEANATFRRVAGLRPRDPRPLYYLGEIALRRDREREARALFDGALRLDSTFTPPLLGLSRWLASRGRHQEALEAAREAVRRNGADGEARAWLRRLEGESGGQS